ncbi:sensor histidine kinase, partial [Clostridium tarantellae]
ETDSKKNCDNQYYRQAVLKSSTGRFIDVEIYLLPFEKKSKLILIRDVTLINRTRKVNSYLEKHFQEEYVKRDFFSNISHELRTPINVIFSALQLNDIYISECNINGVCKNNKMVKQNCLRLIRTINNFIDANKISEGFISPDLHVFNVVEIVENIAQAANKHIKKAGIELIFDAEREEIFIELDKGFLERIVLNILSNSVKYGKIGGEILINIIIKDNNILIVIENNGQIISEEEQQYMFEKFSKNNMAFNRTQEGSGLGLYISKSLMELQGGTLTVEVGNEKGNKFIITYNDVRIFNEEESSDLYISSLNEIMEKVDIEFSDITI